MSKHIWFRGVACAVTGLVTLVSGSAGATVIFPPRDLGELASNSEIVVLARADDEAPFRRGGAVFTRAWFTTLEIVKGPFAPNDTFTVVSPGGRLDDLFWEVAGSPSFVAGRTYLLFLSRSRRGELRPIAASWGILVESVATDGDKILTPLDQVATLGIAPRRDGAMPEPLGIYDRYALISHLSSVARGEAEWDGTQVESSADPQDGSVSSIRKLERADASAVAGISTSLAASDTPPAACVFNGFRLGGSKMTIRTSTEGDQYLSGGGFQETEGAAKDWMNIPNVTLDLPYGGPKESMKDCPDGTAVNSGMVVFNDPCDEVPEYAWAQGGPGNMAGITHTFAGRTWYSVMTWSVIVSKALGQDADSELYQRVLAHELGHCIGYSHFEVASIMYPGDSTWSEIDNQCTQYLYAKSCTVGTTQPCGQGACAGTQTCSASGTWGACSGPAPTAEVCNNSLDDDCDGAVDENCSTGECTPGDTQACGVGACASIRTCTTNRVWGICNGSAPIAEVCNNGVDDDCDGAVDENCSGECSSGDVRVCGVGACAGMQACSANNVWGDCSGPAATAEICGNSIDDDCDGAVDEDCGGGVGTALGTGCGVTRGGEGSAGGLLGGMLWVLLVRIGLRSLSVRKDSRKDSWYPFGRNGTARSGARRSDH